MTNTSNQSPEFSCCEKDGEGTVCSVILPASDPMHHIAGAPESCREEAKKNPYLEDCKAAHQIGALTDFLSPEEDNEIIESAINLPDTGSYYVPSENSRAELQEMFVPAALRKPWTCLGNSVRFSSYYFKLSPCPRDRAYSKFGLFLVEPLPEEAGKIEVKLCLKRGRVVRTKIVPSGVVMFNEDQIRAAEAFQKISLGVILDRKAFVPEYVSLEGSDAYEPSTSTFYLLLPVIQHEPDISVDWELVNKFLSSPIFRQPGSGDHETFDVKDCLNLASGCRNVEDVIGSLVFVPGKDAFFFVSDILKDKNGYTLHDDSKTYVQKYPKGLRIHLAHPCQPMLKAKRVFTLDNLLTKKNYSETYREKVEHFFELPPEICHLKVIGFSKEVGNTLSLLPSVMHRLESFMVAFELKKKLVDSCPEAKDVTVDRILEAITTNSCNEEFSLERLETLGDSLMKLAVSTHLFLKHDALDEGQLKKKRDDLTCNLHLHLLAKKHNLQVYIRDQSLDANQFFAFGHPCSTLCNKETGRIIHAHPDENGYHTRSEKRCSNKTIADVVEALIGAFVIDGGLKAANAFFELGWHKC